MSGEMELTGTALPAIRPATYPEEKWYAGDLVLDAAGILWIRSSDQGVAEGWPWSYTGGWHPCDLHAPGGDRPEEEAVRPLTLLVRGGKPVRTIIYRPGPDSAEIEAGDEPPGGEP